MDLVQDGRGPAQLGQLVRAFDHALPADERREVDDGVAGKELLLEAPEQGGGNDIQLQSHGALGVKSRLGQELGEFL